MSTETNNVIDFNRPASTAEDVVERPFPVDALPKVWQTPIKELSRALQVPPALAAACALATYSAALGKTLWVRHPMLPGGTPGNLFIMGVAPSGGHKTVIFNHLLAVLRKKERVILEQFRSETLPRLRARQKIIKMQMEQLTNSKKGNVTNSADVVTKMTGLQKELDSLDEQMLPPRLQIEDATSEGIVRTLRNGQGTLSLHSDDARKVVDNICGRYQQAKDGTDEAVFLKGYSISDITVDRAKSDSISIPDACLSVLLLIQPDKFSKLLEKDGLVDGGFLPRFLLFSSHAEHRPWPENEPGINPEAFVQYDRIVTELLDTYRLQPETRQFVEFDPEAEDVLRRVDAYACAMQGQYPSSFSPFVSRWTENYWRVALVMHAAEHGANAHKVHLSGATAEAAFKVAVWFIGEQQTLLSGVNQKRADAQADRLINYLQRKNVPLSVRDIQMAKISGNSAETKRLLNQLASEERIMQQPGTQNWMIPPGG